MCRTEARTFSLLLLPMIVLLLVPACRSHPCGRRKAEAPENMKNLPISLSGGRICHAKDSGREQRATVMYWGDNLSRLSVKYIARFHDAGWEQSNCWGYNISSKKHKKLCFRKGRERIDLDMRQTKTPRLGSSFKKASIRVSVFWYGNVNK